MYFYSNYKRKKKNISNNELTVLVPTKKGLQEGYLPQGIIIPMEQVKQNPLEVRQYINKIPGVRYYTAHHEKDSEKLAYIGPAGSTKDRYGFYYYINGEILSAKEGWQYEIQKGWFRTKKITSITELEGYIA